MTQQNLRALTICLCIAIAGFSFGGWIGLGIAALLIAFIQAS